MGETYHYALDEKSLTQRWLTEHVWTRVARRIPSVVSPNLVTASGALAMVVGIGFAYLGVQGHRWGFVGVALCTLLYFVADNVDGLHARRTQRSSHFGEFLDHWTDAINAGILAFCTTLGLGLDGELLVLFVVGVALNYFTTIWEQHQSGVLHSDLFGANEAIIFGIIVYLLLCAFPGASWLVYRPGTLSVATGLAVFGICMSLWSIAKALRRCHRKLYTLLPMLLALAVLSGLAFGGLLAWRHAAAAVLAANVLFSGPLLVDRLIGRRSRLRGWLVSGAALLALALTLFWPRGLGHLLGYPLFLLVVSGLVLLTIGSDFLRVAWSLRRART